MSGVDVLVVRVFPFRKGLGMGNIMWPVKAPGRYGKFPPNHPVGGTVFGEGSQGGQSDGMTKFRERGYWASCFPEGDGITWQPMNGQSDEQCLIDIRECFGWDARWDRAALKAVSP